MEASQQPSEVQELTPAMQIAIAEAAKRAVDEAKTEEEAKTTVPKAIEEEAEAQGYSLSDEERDLIAQATVAAIETRGGFEQPATAPVEQPSAEAPQEGAAPHPQPTEGGEGSEADQPPVGEEEAPGRKSWAERFQGK